MSVSFPHIHSLPLVNRHSPAVSSTALCSGICGVFLKAETGVLMLGTKLEFTSVVLALAAAGEDTPSATFSSCSALKFGKGVFAVVVAMVAKGVFGGARPVLAGICRESSGETATFTLSGAVNQIYIIKYYVTFIYLNFLFRLVLLLTFSFEEGERRVLWSLTTTSSEFWRCGCHCCPDCSTAKHPRRQ